MSDGVRGLASGLDSSGTPYILTEWTTVDSACTMERAKAQIKASELGKWKWAKNPGNGVRRVVFQCNAHKDCGMLKRAVDLDGQFFIQVKGNHSDEPKLSKRANSTLTYEQEEALTAAVNAGGRPAAMRVAMTKTKIEELKCNGLDPLDHKKPNGGLEGARRHEIHFVRMYSHVFLMHPVCIPMNPVCLCILCVTRCLPTSPDRIHAQVYQTSGSFREGRRRSREERQRQFRSKAC